MSTWHRTLLPYHLWCGSESISKLLVMTNIIRALIPVQAQAVEYYCATISAVLKLFDAHTNLFHHSRAVRKREPESGLNPRAACGRAGVQSSWWETGAGDHSYLARTELWNGPAGPGHRRTAKESRDTGRHTAQARAQNRGRRGVSRSDRSGARPWFPPSPP